VGTLCILDTVPHTFTPEQESALKAVARLAVSKLDLRRKARALEQVRDDLLDTQYALRRTEAERARERSLLEATLQATADGIICFGPDLRIITVNQGFREMWSIPEELPGTGDPGPILEAMEKQLKSSQSFRPRTSEFTPSSRKDAVDTLELTDGRVFERSSRTGPLQGGGSIRTSVYRDVSERHQIDQLKSEFVATVSHELRTPLTSIRGALGLMENGLAGALPPQANEFIHIARTNTDRLIRLINDILDLEKIEAGRMELLLAPLSPGAIAAEALRAVDNLAHEAAVTLTSEAGNVGLVLGDSDRLVQVLVNLVSNAVKFSPRGEAVLLRIAAGKPGRIRFEVIDRGPGIPVAQQGKLFKRFQQLDGSDSRATSGTGLGLAICRSIVLQHGGEIGAISTPGQGSTFWLELQHAPPPKSFPHLAAARVLVVDDDASFRAVTCAQLRATGLETVEAATGQEALLRAVQTPPDLIILDVGMPGMGGYEVVAELRRKSREATPLIVYTGNDLSTADRKLLRLGLTCFLTKGKATEDEFLDTVRLLLRAPE
jgi:signal transduction histidine kinase